MIYEEKNKKENRKSEIIKIDDNNMDKLNKCIKEIEKLIEQEKTPEVEKDNKCKKCAYYEYCYL